MPKLKSKKKLNLVALSCNFYLQLKKKKIVCCFGIENYQNP